MSVVLWSIKVGTSTLVPVWWCARSDISTTPKTTPASVSPQLPSITLPLSAARSLPAPPAPSGTPTSSAASPSTATAPSNRSTTSRPADASPCAPPISPTTTPQECATVLPLYQSTTGATSVARLRLVGTVRCGTLTCCAAHLWTATVRRGSTTTSLWSFASTCARTRRPTSLPITAAPVPRRLPTSTTPIAIVRSPSVRWGTCGTFTSWSVLKSTLPARVGRPTISCWESAWWCAWSTRPTSKSTTTAVVPTTSPTTTKPSITAASLPAPTAPPGTTLLSVAYP